jgi:hypothetical protein
MAVIVASVLPSPGDVLKLQRERRQSERAVAYWEQKAAEFASRPTLTRLGLVESMDDENWAHRFVIAPDRLSEVSTFLSWGSNLARLLAVSEDPLKYTLMFRHIPNRFRGLFTKGCADATSSGSPVRMEGTIERQDGRRDLYRAVFMPVGANLVFGAFNGIVREPKAGSLPRLDDRFVGNVVSVIREIQAAGIASLGDIAAALNARGLRTVRGRSWTSATVRNLLLRAAG